LSTISAGVSHEANWHVAAGAFFQLGRYPVA
jgi:hypothetical protein